MLIQKSGSKEVLTNLRVEDLETPLGIDVKIPSFSWQMSVPDGVRGASQKAYQIIVKDEKSHVVWDTKKVEHNCSLRIQYDGEDLKATETYTWIVKVWNQDDQVIIASSWFETGLMNSNPNLTAWDGATWIGGGHDDLPFYAHYLSVFTIKYKLSIEPGSTKAGFVLNANDSRLMDPYKNIYQIKNDENASYVKFELDVSDVDGTENGFAKLNVYRVGFMKDDSATIPFSTVTIPLMKINDENKHNAHNFIIWGTFGTYEVFIDTVKEANVIFNGALNPAINHGDNHDYITHVGMLSEIGFSVDAGQRANFRDIEVNHRRSPANTIFKENLLVENYDGIYKDIVNDPKSKVAIINGAIRIDGGTNGTFIVEDPSRNSMPMLRTQFAVGEKPIKKARLYATARGIYEIYINGNRVGNDYFNPGYTQYNKTHMYQTYDVTDAVKVGGNGIGAMLGEGWWSGLLNYGSNWNYFGDRQSLLAKLVITYDDDSVEVITTNPAKWKYYNDGPVRYSSFFMGEAYDGMKEASISGWSTDAYDDQKWRNTVEIPIHDTTTWEGYSYDDMRLIGQIGENVSHVMTLTAKHVEEVRPRVFVYDMGQNMVGVPKIMIKDGIANNKITMRYAEVLYPKLAESKGNIGMIMQENLRAALNQDTYICKDGEQTITPHFTFHGYRYIEITGIEEALPLEAVQGTVISSVSALSSNYTTSNPMVNKLWENITWSMRGNFLSIPTDTPARNERMGWNGDISVFSNTATYLANVNQFLKRHNLANRNTQSTVGRYTDVTPVGPAFGGILWGSAGLTVPWEAYQQYGDLAMLDEHYDSMKKYMIYLETRLDKTTGLIDEGPLGDWLSPENSKTEEKLLWTAYHAYDLWIMAKISEILGHDNEAELFWERYDERKAFFNRKFVDTQTKKTITSKGLLADSQASYAVPLALGIFNDENISYAAKHLANTVKRESIDDTGVMRPAYSLMTGFIGTPTISLALSENGYHEIAYKLLQTSSYPSWLYSVKNGATTIWERLNSYTVEKGFGGNNGMNSFNHYSFGAVGAWMYNYSLGIQRDPDHPGFKHFILQPTPDPTGTMTWAEGYYDSMYGRINSAWRIENGVFTYKATVPANTTATVYIPTNHVNTVTENGKDISETTGVKFLAFKDEKAIYKLESGSYNFSSTI